MTDALMGMSDHEGREKVWNMIKDIQIALMVTKDGNGHMRSRPMAAQQTEYDGSLWFFTRASSSKSDEIENDSEVLLAYSDPDGQNYVSVTGRAQMIHDRAEIRSMWNEMLRVWFPKGAEDPDIALIRVEVTSAEYWDSPSSTMVLAYGYVKAQLTGEPPNPGDHRRVSFGDHR
jgi:general stress protein 26